MSCWRHHQRQDLVAATHQFRFHQPAADSWMGSQPASAASPSFGHLLSHALAMPAMPASLRPGQHRQLQSKAASPTARAVPELVPEPREAGRWDGTARWCLALLGPGLHLRHPWRSRRLPVRRRRSREAALVEGQRSCSRSRQPSPCGERQPSPCAERLEVAWHTKYASVRVQQQSLQPPFAWCLIAEPLYWPRQQLVQHQQSCQRLVVRCPVQGLADEDCRQARCSALPTPLWPCQAPVPPASEMQRL
mmetsp:Transcript_57245/g.107974  ORF Transcript_57245/g.107974 Transcript_57245/m.107974 type:complete len:249 (+) Transcript_57245:891-1637(+)